MTREVSLRAINRESGKYVDMEFHTHKLRVDTARVDNSPAAYEKRRRKEAAAQARQERDKRRLLRELEEYNNQLLQQRMLIQSPTV